MSYIPFNQLPPSSRLWIFALDRTISEAETVQLLTEVSAFLERWTAHNIALAAGCELRYGRFLCIAVDEATAGASGCSIDELYRRIRLLGETFGVNFMNNLSVFFRNEEKEIEMTTRPGFAELATSGKVSEDTTVFDNSITSVNELHSGKWELLARNSWHASLIRPLSTVTL